MPIATLSQEHIDAFIEQKAKCYAARGITVSKVRFDDVESLIRDYDKLSDFTKFQHRFFGKPTQLLDIHREPTTSWAINISGDSVCMTRGNDYVLLNPVRNLALLFKCKPGSGTQALRLRIYLDDFAIDLDELSQ